MRVSGLRSSCDASATNRRCRSDDACEPAEHLVHRSREAVDLVARAGFRHATVQIAAADLRHLASDPFDGAQHSTDQEPDQHSEQQGRRGHRDRERPSQGCDAVVDVIEGRADDDEDVAVRLHEDAILAPALDGPNGDESSIAARLPRQLGEVDPARRRGDHPPGRIRHQRERVVVSLAGDDLRQGAGIDQPRDLGRLSLQHLVDVVGEHRALSGDEREAGGGEYQQHDHASPPP